MDLHMDLRTLRCLALVAGIPGWQRMNKIQLGMALSKILTDKNKQ